MAGNILSAFSSHKHVLYFNLYQYSRIKYENKRKSKQQKEKQLTNIEKKNNNKQTI